jgi:adenine-specific DNA-methyltransferase
MAKKQKLELTWVGKGEEPTLEPRILIEDPDKSYGNTGSQNMLIHGDNLLALKALEQDYAGKIKCIYIDPPFNTGAAFEHYDDGIEHSIWLDLMYQRFVILYNLLANDGVIFVHLDDSEAAYCKVILDEIFGRNNYINEIINATNKPFGFKSTAANLFKQANHVFLYAKDRLNFNLNLDALFNEKDYDPQYKNVFLNMDEPEVSWRWENINNIVAKEKGFSSPGDAKKILGGEFDREVAFFAIENAEKVFRTASVSGGAYLKRKETIARSKDEKNKIIRHPNDDMDYRFIGGERVLFYSERLKEIDGMRLPGELVTDIWLDIPIEGIAGEGGVDFPKGKKPEKLLSRCILMTTSPGDIILDSFLGSGTTAAVAQKLGRKWIGIELGEQANTHCLPRLKSVIDGTDLRGITRESGWKGGGGFRFYELAPSLLARDSFGNWVIAKDFDANMLAHAMAKQEGFTYNPSQTTYWKQGYSTEKDYVYTTTQYVSIELIDTIHEGMQEDEGLLIACKAFDTACKDRHSNITIKKIPKILLGRCEFGKNDYSLNISESTESEDIDEESAE